MLSSDFFLFPENRICYIQCVLVWASHKISKNASEYAHNTSNCGSWARTLFNMTDSPFYINPFSLRMISWSSWKCVAGNSPSLSGLNLNSAASVGHLVTQTPHPTHQSRSTIGWLSSMLTASTGHILAQRPHPLHASSSVSLIKLLCNYLTENYSLFL